MFNCKSPINNSSLFIIVLTVVVLAVDDVDEPKRMLAIPVGNPLNPAIGSALVSSTFFFGVSFLVESAAPKPDVEVTGAFGGGGLGDSSELNAGSSLDLFLLIFELEEGRDDLSSTNALSGS